MSSSEDGVGAKVNGNSESSSDIPTIIDLGLPPDGGFDAWLQVLGSFFLFFNSW